MEKWHMHRNALIVGVLALLILALLWPLAAHGYDILIQNKAHYITFTQSCLDSTGLWYGLPDSIWIKVSSMDGTQLTDTRLTVADGRVSADNDDSSLVFTDQWQDIDGDGNDSTYEVTITTGIITGEPIFVTQQSKRYVTVIPVLANVDEVEGNDVVDSSGYIGASHVAGGIVDGLNLDDCSGTLANSQIDDDVDVDVNTWNGTTADRDSIIAGAIRVLLALPAVAPNTSSGLIVNGLAAGPISSTSDAVWSVVYAIGTTPSVSAADSLKSLVLNAYANDGAGDARIKPDTARIRTMLGDVINDSNLARNATAANYKATGFSTHSAADVITALDIDDTLSQILTAVDSTNAAIADANKANFKATGFSTHSAADVIAALDIDDTLSQILAAVDSTNAAIADANKPNFKATGFSTHSAADVITALDIDDTLSQILTAANAASANDSLQIRRWVWDSRSGRYDDGLVYARVVDTSKVSEGASATVPDSLLQVANDIDSLLIMAREFIDDAPHDANYGAIGGSGTGAVSDTIFALDTSGTPGHVGSVYIEARNSSGTLQGEGATNGSGYVVLRLPQSTDITLTGFLAGYTWHDTTWTTTSGTTDSDTIKGYNLTIAGASAANLKRIYSIEVGADGDTLSGCQVVATLIAAFDSTGVPFDTSTGQVVGFGTSTKASSTVHGLWTMDLIPNNYISPFGSTWHIVCKNTRGNIRWDYTVTLTGTTQQCLQAILGTGSCP